MLTLTTLKTQHNLLTLYRTHDHIHTRPA